MRATSVFAGILITFQACLLTGPTLAVEPDIVYDRKLVPPMRGDSFRVPKAVFTDLEAGEVFVSDPHNHRIVIFDQNGIFRHQIDGGVIFRSVADLAVDADGRILVLTSRVDPVGLLELDFDGTYLGDINLAGLPEDLEESPTLSSFGLSAAGDRIYMLDTANQRLWLTDRKGLVEDSVDLTMDFDEEYLAERIFGRVDVYGDTVMVSVSRDGKIYLYDLDGQSKGAVGLKGTGPCQTMFPVAAALDQDGKIVVLDKQRAIFMRWDPQTNRCLSQHYGFGNVPGAMYQPDDIALDAFGQLYVIQGFEGRVQVYKGAIPAAGSTSSQTAGR